MARPPRLELPGVPLHVIQRGNNRASCFFGDADRRFYLRCLSEAAARRGCAVHAYVLMSNHVHLLLTPNERGAVAAMLQDIGRRYVRVVNNVHGRTGTLWEGRFRSSLVDSENYLMACHQYIEMNPVRAGLANHPGDYPWSSYAHYSGERFSALITQHPIYRASEMNLDPTLIARIRSAINTDTALGSEAFLEEAEAVLGRPVGQRPRGRPPRGVTGKLL